MSGPSAVAIVLHFRTPGATLQCLDSLCASGVTRAVVIDNSADEGASLAMMSKGLDDLRRRGLLLDMVASPANLGFAAGVNVGIAHVMRDGPASVLLLNSDAQLNAAALHALLNAVWDGAVAASPVAVGAGDAAALRYHRWLGLLLPAWVPGGIAFLSGACLMLSAQVVRPGLLDEDFFFYGEDIELCDRLSRGGGRLAFCPGVSVAHQGSQSARRGSLFYEYHTVRWHWLLACKLTRRGPSRALAVACQVVLLSARAAFRALRWRSMVPVRAFARATVDVVRGVRRDLTPPTAGAATGG